MTRKNPPRKKIKNLPGSGSPSGRPGGARPSLVSLRTENNLLETQYRAVSQRVEELELAGGRKDTANRDLRNEYEQHCVQRSTYERRMDILNREIKNTHALIATTIAEKDAKYDVLNQDLGNYRKRMEDFLREKDERISLVEREYALKEEQLDKSSRKNYDLSTRFDGLHIANKDLQSMLKENSLKVHRSRRWNSILGFSTAVAILYSACITYISYHVQGVRGAGSPSAVTSTVVPDGGARDNDGNHVRHYNDEDFVPAPVLPIHVSDPIPETAAPAYDPLGKSVEQVVNDVREYALTQMDLGSKITLGPGCKKGLEQIGSIYDRMNGTETGKKYFMEAMGDEELCDSLGNNNTVTLKL